MVLVVHQLLTGFNAPTLNCLYVDRTLKGALHIQAYSRTNRVQLFQTKPFGRIVLYRWPNQSTKYIHTAIQVYANRHSANVQLTVGPEHNSGDITKSYNDLKDTILKIVKEAASLTHYFTNTPPSTSAQETLYNLHTHYNLTLAKLKQEHKYTLHHPTTLLSQIGHTPDQTIQHTTVIAGHLLANIATKHYIHIRHLTLQNTHVLDIRVT